MLQRVMNRVKTFSFRQTSCVAARITERPTQLSNDHFLSGSVHGFCIQLSA
jgi:hypothetical protein